MLLNAPISAGDLLDRVSILDIKLLRLPPEKLDYVRTEMDLLRPQANMLLSNPDILSLYGDLRHRNELLWNIEDNVRVCHRAQNYDGIFVEEAKKIAPYNDERARIKRLINDHTGSVIVEMKSHL